MKYFSLLKEVTSKGPHISMCIISRSCVLLVAHFFMCLVCLPLIQSTQILRSIKSKSKKISFFTNLNNLSLEMWPKRLCHKQVECSFTKPRLVPTLWCKVKKVSAKRLLRFNLYKPSQRIPEPIKWLCLNKLKHPLPNLKEYPLSKCIKFRHEN